MVSLIYKFIHKKDENNSICYMKCKGIKNNVFNA